jgi:large subunit ribosomal protein L14e
MRERARELFQVPDEKQTTVFAPGAVCLKIAGRDAGKRCVITSRVDERFVTVDGFVRPRKVSIRHLEPTGAQVDLAKAKDSKAIQAALSA